MKSIRGALWRSTALAVVTAVVLSIVLIFSAANQVLVSDFHEGLEITARTLGTLLSFDARGIDFDFSGEAMPEFTPGHHIDYFQLWGPDGRLLELSENLSADTFDRRVQSVDQPVFWDVTLPDGQAGTAVGLLIPVDRRIGSDIPLETPQPLVSIVFARSREALDAQLWRMLIGAVATGAAAFAVALVMLRRALRIGLAPLVLLGEELEQIGVDPVTTTVTEQGLPAELRVCAAKVNALVDRLSQALAEQQRVTDGLAHELRTPVATLRSAMDLVNQWPEDERLLAKSVGIATDVSVRMGAIIGAMMRFSRLRRGERLALAHVDLPAMVRQIVRRQPPGRPRELLLLEPPSDMADLVTDAELLEIALSNLIGNAFQHSPAGSSIECDCWRRGTEFGVRIVNDAPGLTAADLPRLGEPFWRKDSSRSDPDHAGMGLGLVMSVVRVLGGRCEFELSKGRLEALLRVPGRDGTGESPGEQHVT